MRAINVTELRNHLPRYLSSVQQGAEILVTSHGHVIARILPPENTQRNALNQLKELRKHAEIGDITSPIDEDWDAEK